jgi:hypothetical protein
LTQRHLSGLKVEETVICGAAHTMHVSLRAVVSVARRMRRRKGRGKQGWKWSSRVAARACPVVMPM